MGRIVVALGGNALSKAGEKGTWSEQIANMEETALHLARLVVDGEELVLTHGNGPQVGALLLQQEAAKFEVSSMPMHTLGAMTQGWIGYLIQQTLPKALEDVGPPKRGKRAKRASWPPAVLPMVTRVLVSPRDPSFRHPTKPVGPYYSENEARLLKKQYGWSMIHDAARGGYRRLVPSPVPLELLEGEALGKFMDMGLGRWAIPVVTGGGGVPVIRRSDGTMEGVDAVVDKDRTAALLARAIGASTLAIITDVSGVSIGFRSENETQLNKVNTRSLRRYLAAGEFGEGSMKPKVEAALDFLKHGGKKAIITDAHSLSRAIAGAAGTIIEH
jgi:carbamate kinase